MVAEVISVGGEPQVGQAVEQRGQGDVLLEAGQPGTWAMRLADGEGDVPVGVGAVEVEVRRALEHPGVPVGGGITEVERRALGDLHATDFGVGERDPPEALRGGLEPQVLLHEVADLAESESSAEWTSGWPSISHIPEVSANVVVSLPPM